MHIAFAASECVPFSKTGGLADVVGAVPRALAALGHKVSVYTPLYRNTKLENPKTAVRSITVPFDDQYRFCSIVDGGMIDGVQFYFVDYPAYFDRDALYGTPIGDYHDNAERFALFSRAVIEGSKILGVPDIFHCHDWQSALIPVLLRTLYAEDPAFDHAKIVFTIHNMGYQGLFPGEILPLLMLPWDLFTLTKMEFYGKVNFLKGALVYADFVTTVSRRYALEIQTAEYGFGLEGVLRGRSGTVAGILNGVDYSEWSPETDRFIAAKFSADSLAAKAQDKADLLREFGLPETKLPVVGIVSRFAAQKGFDLIQQVGDRLAREEAIFVVLGSGDKTYEDLMRRLSKQYPNRFAVRVAYDNALAHKIEAGSDMFLMPSRYEPCGLNQIYSLRYGTVPIVRATGGLDDTIENWDPITNRGTGFKFVEYSGEDMLDTVRKALELFKDKTAWQKLMRNGMARDFSWNTAAKEYVRVYEKAKQVRAPMPV
ncbi:glycogen synthase (ADP-glucose) [Candidatus Koribacter versatilis Ellin345]|uniref:Glycogen synthase n=1 Tax=Koribacter versatilis (strain Ellin345) TaxID=204669 RepID=GLGA_KORVE|nr:glycogen synthase GlgA [Candidatus Koribacter versatilis]Q1ILA0.1 RecName: Full=Glycogen synthase; AltName: Full=Starch [bacterial glycogen] synthase [Candidatus Koribacter versatilis Ellin345]ABF42350.1 glycogen synthase (ADP-glucose) [Candidatus Koribacter versatilis Ellin345]